ncbi:MAG: phosphate acyltransferase, partial [Alphaproteobacteria bacterium]
AVDVALNPEARRTYPFMRLTGPANVLVMPAIHSASIGTKLLQMMGGCTVLGPLLVGTRQSVQIASLNAPVSELVNIAALAAFDISEDGPC